MANYATLKAAIAAAIKQNGNNEITGNLLQQQLLAMVNSLGAGYEYAGVAHLTPSQTDPGTPDQNVFYIVSEPGAYSNFDGLIVSDGEIAIFKYNGSWSKDSTGAATYADVQQIKNAVLGVSLSYGGFINQSGIYTTNQYFRASGFVRVSPGDSIEYALNCYGGTCIAAYAEATETEFMADSSVMGTQQEGFQTGTYIVPNGVKYVRFSNYVRNYPNPVIKIELNNSIVNVLGAVLDVVSSIAPKLPSDDFSANLIADVVRGQYVTTDGLHRTYPDLAYCTAGVVGGKTYRFLSSYSDPSTESPGDNVLCFFDKYGAPISKPTVTKISNNVGQVVAPNNSVTLQFNVYTSQVATAYAKELLAENQIQSALGWLLINETNLDENIKSRLIQPTPAVDFHLWESIKKPIQFSGKKLVAFGDSITYGVCSPGLGNAGNDKYIQTFCDIVGANLFSNQAVSGSTITHVDGSATDIYSKVLAYSGDAEIIWVAGGTNDWNQGKPLGTLTDTDVTTFYGALRGICEYIKTNYPNATVIFVTPIPYTNNNQYSSIMDIDYYRTAIYDIATIYGYNVVNGSSLGMPQKSGGWNNLMCDDSDGCHPTVAGHKLYGRNLSGKLV